MIRGNPPRATGLTAIVSEKSERDALDYSVTSGTGWKRFAFQPQMQRWSCSTAAERYNSSGLVLKKGDS